MERLNLKSLPGLSGITFDNYNPAAHARMKADTINSTPGSLAGIDCPKCKNRGSIALPREDGSVSVRDCDCMKIRRCIWEMEKSGLKNIIREKTFDSYAATEPWQMTIKAGAVAYAEHPEGWLLFCGQPGSGKTHLCTAIARHRLLAGDEVRYMAWRDKVTEIKALSLDNDRRAELLQLYKTVQILYIDDLFKIGRAADGTATPTAADVGIAFEILNARYINHLTTIISTEKTPQELVEIDEATGSRIIEMAGGNVYAISRNTSRNYRLRNMVTV